MMNLSGEVEDQSGHGVRLGARLFPASVSRRLFAWRPIDDLQMVRIRA
jgi:hypothetical protein